MQKIILKTMHKKLALTIFGITTLLSMNSGVVVAETYNLSTRSTVEDAVSHKIPVLRCPPVVWGC